MGGGEYSPITTEDEKMISLDSSNLSKLTYLTNDETVIQCQACCSAFYIIRPLTIPIPYLSIKKYDF